MVNIQIESVGFPFQEPGFVRLAVQVLTRATAMGLLDKKKVIEDLVWDGYQQRIAEMAKGGGIAMSLAAEAKSLQQGNEIGEYRGLVERIAVALEGSPVPDKEWKALLDVFAPQDLAALLGTSASSVRRYSEGKRATPGAVAERLHSLALVVGDLAGAYNDYGIRRWFNRKRKLLSGKAPADLLTGSWEPGARGPTSVRELAASLVALSAT
ncbi:MAG: hypothetical protein JRI68_18660 [Deltaproteobacteria bacterium]|nr:hypothetical protein [Deltaproteobacteria bacterium]